MTGSKRAMLVNILQKILMITLNIVVAVIFGLALVGAFWFKNLKAIGIVLLSALAFAGVSYGYRCYKAPSDAEMLGRTGIWSWPTSNQIDSRKESVGKEKENLEYLQEEIKRRQELMKLRIQEEEMKRQVEELKRQLTCEPEKASQSSGRIEILPPRLQPLAPARPTNPDDRASNSELDRALAERTASERAVASAKAVEEAREATRRNHDEVARLRSEASNSSSQSSSSNGASAPAGPPANPASNSDDIPLEDASALQVGKKPERSFLSKIAPWNWGKK